MAMSPDTIFALSSGRPPAAVAVVRISGPRASDALTALAGRIPDPRCAAFARLRDPVSREIIDEALALWFPGPRSETGEDMAELQLHGGRAVLAATFAALGRLEGFRPAEAGEFTRRAFHNGKLDLTRVEGLADLIAADSEAQRRQAVRQLRGVLGERAESWRTRLIEALALVEARIDFSDEGDVPEDLLGPALTTVKALREEIAAALADRRGERLRDGLVVAIAGPPNAGKSSLLNRIARREAAIVSPYAGTTRDVIEVHLDLGGYPVTLLDTAGIRDSDDPVEQEGVRRARERAEAADLVLWVVDATEVGTGSAPPPRATETWVVRNKIDLLPEEQKYKVDNPESRIYNISVLVGTCLKELLTALEQHARTTFGAAEPALVTRVRHRGALDETLGALDRAVAEAGGQVGTAILQTAREEIIAEELRLAARALGRLVGRVDVEDILDVIFRDFCIGK